jgi:hypothetical protein
LEIVIVRRSLDAAKAIRDGKSRSLTTSVNMTTHFFSTLYTTTPPRYARQACLSVSAAD